MVRQLTGMLVEILLRSLHYVPQTARHSGRDAKESGGEPPHSKSGRVGRRPLHTQNQGKNRTLKNQRCGTRLDAGGEFVGPLLLDGVGAYLLGFPGADVADFAVGVVVPALAWDGVGNGFTKFVRRGGAEDRERG